MILSLMVITIMYDIAEYRDGIKLTLSSYQF